ncbi:hypothetical protein [Prosthecobacter sp.]|uniref:hypothetical protein n=1 Tax=Prosthecobacter sp. TaxID=1965333 RepID=UPI003784B115
MKTHQTHNTLFRRAPRAALAAIMSLALVLKPAYAVDATVGNVMNGGAGTTYSLDGGPSGTIINGGSSNGLFLQSGNLNLSNLTLQNFSVHGGDGSGGGAALGGALFINSGSVVTLNNVNFLSNNVQGGNGGVGLTGGSLNNLFNAGSHASSGSAGYTPPYDMLADINGASGTKGGNGASSASGFGGVGGNGSSGTSGGSSNPLLLAAVATSILELTAGGEKTAADASNPLTENVAAGDAAEMVVKVINLAVALTDVVVFDTALATGQVGVGGSAGSGGQGGNSGFGYGGAAGGNGGNGGAGGQPASPSLLAGIGGAAGGDAGSGGSGGMGGFGAGGGAGGTGGVGGAGASWSLVTALAPVTAVAGQVNTTPSYYDQVERFPGQDDNGNPVQKVDPFAPNFNTTPSYYTDRMVNGTFHPSVTTVTDPVTGFTGWDALTGSRPNGLDGSGGAGGNAGFGGGAGATGVGYSTLAGGGAGGNGYGGSIFVRSGGTLHITGDALFDGNGVRGGQGQTANPATNSAAGASGIGVGTDIFLMTGATLLLDPGAGHTITFNGNAYNTSIADDSAASIIPSGGFNYIPSGSGADVHIQSGLVEFNGANVYSGQTIIEGGTLRADDTVGIYWDSNVNFAGTPTSNAVLMSDGTAGNFSRYVGTLSNRVQWTGSGGFAAVVGDLTVNLSNNKTLQWGAGSFVPTGSALVFGADQATNNVIFQNNMDLKGGSRTVLSTTSSAASGANADGTPMGSTVYLSGKISDTTGGASLNINDANHDGTVVLDGASTYTGTTNINAGDVLLNGSLSSSAVNVSVGATLDSINAGLASVSTVTNAGTLNLGSKDDTITTLTNTGHVTGTATLTATTYNLNDGSVLDAKLGTGTIITSGAVTLNSTVGASVITVNPGSTLNLAGADIISHSAAIAVNGVLNLTGGAQTFQTLTGTGTVHTNGNMLSVSDGSTFLGSLDAPGSNLTTGTGGTGGSLVLGGGGTTTTQSTQIDNGLTITGGTTLNSTTITIANGSTLDLSGGGTINFTTLTTPSGSAPGIINIGANDFIVPVGSTISGDIKFIGTGNVIILGTIAPGHSPGITDMTGAGLSPTIGGAFKAEVAGTGGVGGTDFDQMRIAAGATATLGAGSSLNVASFGSFIATGGPAQGNSFQIISGPLGAVPINHLIGTFTTVTFDADGIAGAGAPVTNAAVVFDVNTGAVTATGLNSPTSTFADLGSNANQRGAAASIFAAAFVGQNQIDSSTTAGLLALQITDAAGSSAADLARYTPDYYGSLADYAFIGNQVLARSIQDRVSPMTYIPSQIGEDSISQVPETMSLFVGYTYANMNTADGAKGTRNDYYAGMNLLASEDYVFGIAGSGSQGSLKAALGSAQSDGWGGMAFGRFTVAKSFTFYGSFGFNQQTMDLRRQTVNGSVSGSTDVSSYVGFFGVQYKGWRVGGVSIAPRMSLTYSNSQMKGFNESGAIDALNIGGYHNNRFVGEIGLSALWSTDLAGHALNVELAASVQQYFQNTKSQMLVNVATVPTAAYGVNFAQNGNTQAVIQLNTGYEITKSVQAYMGYEGHFGNQNTQYGKAGIRINF